MNKEILFLTHHITSGGAEKAVRTLATYMNAHCDGYHAQICVVYDDAQEHARLEAAGVPVLVLQTRSNASDSRLRKGINVLRQIRELRRIKREHCIDVCISLLSGADILNVLSNVGEREIVSVRNEESRFVHNLLQKWYREVAYLRCDRITAVSQRAAADVVQYFGIDKDKVVAIPNAIQEPVVTDVSDAAYLSLVQDRYVYINVARLFSAKGQDHLLRAFAIVHRAHPDTVLALIGGGPEEENLRTLAAELGVESVVYFAGMQSCPAWYMQHADTFVLSSNAEGMPNAILEAMQAGLPVISTDCGAREILAPDTDPLYQTDHVDEAAYGILIPIGEEDCLAEAMQRMREEPEMAERYKMRNAERLNAYTMSAVMDAWIREIERA